MCCLCRAVCWSVCRPVCGLNSRYKRHRSLPANVRSDAPVARYPNHRLGTALCDRSLERAGPEFDSVAFRSCETGAKTSATCLCRVPPVFPSTTGASAACRVKSSVSLVARSYLLLRIGQRASFFDTKMCPNRWNGAVSLGVVREGGVLSAWRTGRNWGGSYLSGVDGAPPFLALSGLMRVAIFSFALSLKASPFADSHCSIHCLTLLPLASKAPPEKSAAQP